MYVLQLWNSLVEILNHKAWYFILLPCKTFPAIAFVIFALYLQRGSKKITPLWLIIACLHQHWQEGANKLLKVFEYYSHKWYLCPLLVGQSYPVLWKHFPPLPKLVHLYFICGTPLVAALIANIETIYTLWKQLSIVNRNSSSWTASDNLETV